MTLATPTADLDAPAEAPRTGPVEVAAITLGVLVLVTILRAWLPAVIMTHPTGLWAAVAVCAAGFALVLLAVPVGRWVGADRLAVAGALVAALAMIAAGTQGHGSAGLLSVALGGGLVWLGATAMTVRSGRWAAIGLVGGIGAAVALHAILNTVDLLWRRGPLPTTELAVLACAFVGTVAGAVNWYPDAPGRRAGVRGTVWLLAGPAIALSGMVTGATARADVAAEAVPELPPGWGSAGVCAAAVLATVLAARPRLTRHPVVPAVALLAAVAGAMLARFRIGDIDGVPPSWTVGCQIVGALALGACVGWVGVGVDTRAKFASPADQAVRRGIAAAIGVLGLLALVSVYLVADTVAPRAAALALAVCAVLTGRRALRWGAPAGRPAIDAAVAACAVAAAIVVALAQLLPTGTTERNAVLADFPVRLMAYDIHLAYGADGRFQPEAVAATIRAQKPDIVLLGEVDRGWFPGGGHDSLQLIADRLGMRAIFVPTGADPARGDALLTRLPVTRVHGEVLPSGVQLLSAIVSVGEHELGMVGARLVAAAGSGAAAGQADVTDARAAARIAVALAEDDRPVVLAGNLGAPPGSAAFAALTDGILTDGLAGERPLYTYPSGRPTRELDGLFLTSNLAVTNVRAPAGAGSPHLPVAVTLRLTDPEALRPASTDD